MKKWKREREREPNWTCVMCSGQRLSPPTNVPVPVPTAATVVAALLSALQCRAESTIGSFHLNRLNELCQRSMCVFRVASWGPVSISSLTSVYTNNGSTNCWFSVRPVMTIIGFWLKNSFDYHWFFFSQILSIDPFRQRAGHKSLVLRKSDAIFHKQLRVVSFFFFVSACVCVFFFGSSWLACVSSVQPSRRSFLAE